MSDYIKLSELSDSGVRNFLCWPVFEESIYLDRLTQLQRLEVEAIALGGPHSIMSSPVLGKGNVGVVLRAIWRGIEVALKVRRTDSDRSSMDHEAKFLSAANTLNIGPKLFAWSRDFLVQERLDGVYLRDWVEKNGDNSHNLIIVLRCLIVKAWRLDQIGLDHGELVKVRRHFIITDNGPRIIDFESASLDRRPHNLASVIQSLYLNLGFRRLIEGFIETPSSSVLIDALRKYKETQSEENFNKVLKICNLE